MNYIECQKTGHHDHFRTFVQNQDFTSIVPLRIVLDYAKGLARRDCLLELPKERGGVKGPERDGASEGVTWE